MSPHLQVDNVQGCNLHISLCAAMSPADAPSAAVMCFVFACFRIMVLTSVCVQGEPFFDPRVGTARIVAAEFAAVRGDTWSSKDMLQLIRRKSQVSKSSMSLCSCSGLDGMVAATPGHQLTCCSLSAATATGSTMLSQPMRMIRSGQCTSTSNFTLQLFCLRPGAKHLILAGVEPSHKMHCRRCQGRVNGLLAWLNSFCTL